MTSGSPGSEVQNKIAGARKPFPGTEWLQVEYSWIFGGAGLVWFCIILIAGLSPFHVPKNDVNWLEQEDGLRFGRHGSMVTTGPIRPGDADAASSSTLELWLEPSRDAHGGTILSFDGSAHPGDPFSLHEDDNALRIDRHNIDSRGITRTAGFKVEEVFAEKKPVFVTITLSEHQTSVYLNGGLSKVSTLLGSSENNLTGRLLLSCSPTTHDSWSGDIRGLAIYHQRLTPGQVVRHYESWVKFGNPTIAKDEAPMALYLFNERDGETAHNQLDATTNLAIPSHYFVLHPAFLARPWKQYHPTWSYWQDVGINVAGFIPFGFLAVAYLSSLRATPHPAITAIAMGFATSLVIESLQAFLPTRTSDMTDVVTNTVGTIAGVMLYRLLLQPAAKSLPN
jgi:VanZ family protein